MADKPDDMGFMQRWSKRKIEARAGDDAGLPSVDEGDLPKGQAEAKTSSDADPQLPPADLPDVDTLDAASDYTAFLGENVPEDLAKMALRKLWRSDPLLANLDGLNDYDEDFSKVGMVTEVMKTAYRVGQGFLTEDNEAENVEDRDEVEPEENLVSDADTVSDTEVEGGVADDGEGESPDGDEVEFHHMEFIKPG